jgi:4-nitrophenyl phosphatase
MSTKDLCVPLNESNAKSLVDNNDTFLFDCDGVIWNLPRIFPGAIELLNYLTEKVGKSNFL